MLVDVKVSQNSVPLHSAGRCDEGVRTNFSSTLSFNDFLEVLFDCRPEALREGSLPPQPWPCARVTINVSLSLLWEIISKVSPFYWRKWYLEAQTGCPADWPEHPAPPLLPPHGLHSFFTSPQLHSLRGKWLKLIQESEQPLLFFFSCLHLEWQQNRSQMEHSCSRRSLQ